MRYLSTHGVSELEGYLEDQDYACGQACFIRDFALNSFQYLPYIFIDTNPPSS